MSYSAQNVEQSYEYGLIEKFYRNKRAKRSGLLYMNHINEGLYILEQITASRAASLGFCLHPLVQGDNDFADNMWLLRSDGDTEALCCALEFRNIANRYLSGDYSGPEDVISLSPVMSVNNMLFADKIQNYKDFLIYHKDTHPRSRELNQYFLNWFDRLGVSMSEFDKWNARLTEKFNYGVQ